MSATVMHEDQKLGVVDPSCKVHGVDNLWIADPSVFPTPSHANPMLMIVALSMYVGDNMTAVD